MAFTRAVSRHWHDQHQPPLTIVLSTITKTKIKKIMHKILTQLHTHSDIHFADSSLLAGSALTVAFIIRNFTRKKRKEKERKKEKKTEKKDSNSMPLGQVPGHSPSYSVDLSSSSEMASRRQLAQPAAPSSIGVLPRRRPVPRKSPYALHPVSEVSPSSPLKQFQRLSDWRWPSLVLLRKIV